MPDNLTDFSPLLDPSELAHQAIPFDRIDVDMFGPAIDAAIERARARVRAITDSKEPATFENTVLALEVASEDLDQVVTVYYNLLGAETSDALQALAAEIGPKHAAFGNDVILDPALFARVRDVFEGAERATLTVEQQRLIEESYSSFTRNGALLDAEGKARLRTLDEELSVLSPKFSENLLKATNAFGLHVEREEELRGLPQTAMEAAAQAAREKGHETGWLIGLQMPSLLPVLKFADDRGLRERVWRANSARALGGDLDNRDILKCTARLRHERAVLLGYASHADFVLEKRMAGDLGAVRSFLDRLLDVARPAAERELAELTEFAVRQGGPETLMPWDVAYYAEKLRVERFDFDDEVLRPYFRLEAVIDGVFAHAERLFGLRFAKASGYPIYHEEVEVFEVTDREGGFIGLLYADLFPRESKNGGAWKTEYRSQGLWRGQVGRPHVSIVCNFTRSTPERPSLLTFMEVETLFHEFGHALHELLSQCTYRSLAGTNVMWDFVELPSQIMENWVSEKAGLDVFARHWQTGEPMPPDLAAKIKESATFMAATALLRQLTFAYLDLAWHDADPGGVNSVDDFEEAAIAGTRLLPKIAGTNISCAFGHIFAGGYAAGYYSYKWAEVLDADAFELFRERGLFDPETAAAFKTHILERGGTEPPMDLYKRFRGREPDPDALLRRDGLI